MLKSKLASIAAAAALSFGVVGAVQAGPLGLIAGDFKFTIDNYDSGTTGYGAGSPVCSNAAACDAAAPSKAPGSIGSVNASADTMGIFSVALITRISDNSVFWQKGNGEYLTGVFGNLVDYRVSNVDNDGSMVTSTRAEGGTWALYKTGVDYDPTHGPSVQAGVLDLNALLYPGITGGQAWLSGIFATGVRAGDTQTTYASTYNTDTVAGAGQGYLDVTGGTEQTTFDTNSLTDKNGEKRDLFMDITFNDADGKASKTCGDINDPSTCWTVTSAGQIKGQAVPEPGTMALAGLALLGAGLASRRRKS